MTRKARMCKSKARYRTRWQANQRARDYGQRSYRCPFCHHYHLTSKTLKLDLGYGVRVWV